MQSPNHSANVGAPAVEPTPEGHSTVAPASPLPRCCQAWIAETTHTWHRQHGREPLSPGRPHRPARS